MRQLPRARALRTLLVVLVALAGATCREPGLTGPGWIAPTPALLAVVPRFAASAPDLPIAPYRSAHVELYSVPAGLLARDTTIRFADGDTTTTVSLALTITENGQRFLLALTLLDDQGRAVYSARDTVTAYPAGSATPPPPTIITLVYTGPDTAAASLAIAPRDTVLGVGDLLQYRATVRRADGTTMTGAAIGFSVRGTGVAIGTDGTLRATAVATALVIARLATGRSDSTGVTVVARGIVTRLTLSPDTTVTILPGGTLVVTADARDATGAPVARAPAWRSSDSTIARVAADAVGRGVVTARATGTATITATLDGVSASMNVRVSAPPGPATVVVAPPALTLASLGEVATLSATVRDAAGTVLAAAPTWTSRDSTIVTVSAAGQLQARGNGAVWVVATATPAADSARVTVRQVVDTIALAPDSLVLALGDTATVRATLLDRNRNGIPDITPTFTSGDTTVATVSGAGVVRIVGAGATTVTVAAGGRTASVRVRLGQGSGGVTARYAYIRITPGGGAVAMGGTLQLAAELVDARGVATPITPAWASDQPGRAPVTGSGLVTFVDTTTATITATQAGIAGHAVFTVQPAPAMTSFSFAPTTLTGASRSGVRFSVSIGAADPGGGIGSVAIVFTAPDGSTAGCAASVPVTGSARRGAWDCVVTLPAGSTTGTWHATRVTLAGSITRTLDESQLAGYGATTLTVAP